MGWISATKTKNASSCPNLSPNTGGDDDDDDFDDDGEDADGD